MTQTTVPREDERAVVESWRLHVLLEAGYSLQLADRLAVVPDVDLHQAVELVDNGCPHLVAALILL